MNAFDINQWANIEFKVPHSQRYLFNAIPDTNHDTNPTNHRSRIRYLDR